MLNIPVDTFILPEVNTNDPTDNVPDPKVTVPVFTWVYAPVTLNVPVLNSIVPVPLENVPVLVSVDEPKFRVLEFKFKVVITFKFLPSVKFDVPFNVKTLTALVVPLVVGSIFNVFVLDPKNTKVAEVFPTIFPPDPVIEPMAVVKLPGLRVKFPEVMVNAYNESVVGDPLLPPNLTPPTPFKIKLAG